MNKKKRAIIFWSIPAIMGLLCYLIAVFITWDFGCLPEFNDGDRSVVVFSWLIATIGVEIVVGGLTDDDPQPAKLKIKKQ